MLNLTLRSYESGRSCMKMDGLKIDGLRTWTVPKSRNGRSQGLKLNGHQTLRWKAVGNESARPKRTVIFGSQLLHPKVTTSLMALHPKGKKVVHYIPGPLHPKWHYIQKATTSHKPLHPTMLLHPMYHFIPQCYYIPCTTASHNATSSHLPLHPVCHFIPYATSSQMSLGME